MRQQSRGPGRTLFERMSAIAGKRGDRIVIDDPRPMGSPEQQAAARAQFAEAITRTIAEGDASVVIVAKLEPEATRYCARCDKAVPIVHNCPECKGPVF